MPTITYEEALEQTEGRTKHLLLGNGFSMAQSDDEFSYQNLLDRSGLENGSPIKNVFDQFDTKDFELVMSALEHAAKVEEAYGNEERAAEFIEDADAVREALITAVHSVHPDHQFDIPDEQVTACARFIGSFEKIFTLNYDLLLYWMYFRARSLRLQRIFNYSDGCGLQATVNGFREFSEGGICRVYNLHGGLHLFLGPQKETLKRVVTGERIIEDIEETIRRDKKLPLFVAEGSSPKKMAKINSVPYLRHCYEQLSEISDCVFVFGHSADERDRHIYNAIFTSEINDVYFCVHNPDDNLEIMQARMAPFQRLARANDNEIGVHFIDAATANVWGDE